eukprot:854329-Rhodomonas_salina.1
MPEQTAHGNKAAATITCSSNPTLFCSTYNTLHTYYTHNTQNTHTRHITHTASAQHAPRARSQRRGGASARAAGRKELPEEQRRRAGRGRG